MKRIAVVILVLVLSAVACSVQVAPAIPTTLAPTVVKPTNTATTVLTTPDWTATVSQIAVNVREKPDGAVIALVKSGDIVHVLSCDGNWCKIEKPAGYIFRGCLDEVAGTLKCQSKE